MYHSQVIIEFLCLFCSIFFFYLCVLMRAVACKMLLYCVKKLIVCSKLK